MLFLRRGGIIASSEFRQKFPSRLWPPGEILGESPKNRWRSSQGAGFFRLSGPKRPLCDPKTAISGGEQPLHSRVSTTNSPPHQTASGKILWKPMMKLHRMNLLARELICGRQISRQALFIRCSVSIVFHRPIPTDSRGLLLPPFAGAHESTIPKRGCYRNLPYVFVHG